MSPNYMFGQTAPSGHKALIGQKARTQSRNTLTGTFGKVRQNIGHTRMGFIIRLNGVAGRHTAPGRWATWPAIPSTCLSALSRWDTPTVIEAEDFSPMNNETYPLNSRLRFEFPARDGMVPMKFWWYDGKKDGNQNQPNKDVASKIRNHLRQHPGQRLPTRWHQGPNLHAGRLRFALLRRAE